MEVFGMRSRSPRRLEDEGGTSFDYLKDATARSRQNPNESISFLLDASAIGTSGATDSVNTGGEGRGAASDNSLASTKEQKQAFYTLHNTALSEFLTSSPSTRSRSKANNNNNNHDNNGNSNRYKSKLASPKSKAGAISSSKAARDAERSLSPYSLPSLGASKQTQIQKYASSPAPSRPKINTRRSLTKATSGAKNKKHSTTTMVTPTPGSGRRGAQGKPVPQTPGGFWTTNTESKTFVNGLLSPFSPLLHSALHKKDRGNQRTGNLATISSFDNEDDQHGDNKNDLSMRQQIKNQREEFMQFVSLQPCRKVSVVVRVTAVNENDEDAKRCIFPHFKDSMLAGEGEPSVPNQTNSDPSFATPKGKGTKLLGSPTSLLSSPGSKASLTSPTHRRDVVVVNPTAFGKYIPSQVTMETAKLVAQVANIASEDWARLYEFHHVMWPTPTKSREGATGNDPTTRSSPRKASPERTEDLSSSYNTIDSISRAVVQDLFAEHKSSLLISLGHESSCFGTTVNPLSADGKGSSSSIGLWPKIMNQCSAMLETKGVVRLTMVEILEPSGGGKNGNNADSFRDLLAPSDQKPTSIHLRHHDMKGAVIEGLCEVEIDSMPALLEALARTRQRRAQRRKGKNSTAVTATAVIGTLLYWEHAVSYELNKPPNATVTCAELASNQSITPSSDGHTSSDSEKLESITQRKSVVSLGQAMRQLLLQQAHGYEKALGLSTSELAPVVSYRETTLTKVLQRSMESSKIVLVASISPLSRNYENTVFTLNYLRRLLVKPGSTLTSPFGGRNNKGTPKTAKTDNRTNQTINSTNTSIINRTVLSSPEAMESKEKLKIISNDPKYIEQLVSDPRQRLARLFGISPPRNKKSKPWSNVLDRMEGSQKSTRGTLTAIRVTGPDTSTLSSNSARASPGLPNSYTGPQEEETRQVVESPGSTQQNGQPRQSWQTEEDEDDGGVHDYQIPFVGDGLDSNIIDGGSNEWDSEEEIERELLMSARKKERTLQKEIEEIEETISYDEDGEEENDGENGDAENEAIEVDLQGVHGEGFAPGAKDAGNTSGQALQEIVPEGSYYDDEDAEDNQEPLEYAMPEESNQGDPPGDQIADVIPSAPTDVTNMIRNQLEEEFAPMDDDVGGNSVENGDEYDGDETLGLQPITVETVGNDESLTEVDDNRQTLFTDEEWQTQEGTEASILGLKPIEVVEPPLNAFSGVLDLDPNHAEEDSTDGRNQTNYDLPDDPLPVRDSVDRVNIQSSPLSSPYHSPFQQRQAFNTHASPYSVRLKTAKSREYVELTNEREELRTTVTRLREDLRKVTEERDTNIEQYEIQIQKLNGNLNEAAEAKRELETVASQAITARTSSAQEMENYVEEREQLQRTVNQLRRDLERVSETQEDQLHRHRAEIDEFQLKLSRAMATQKEIEGIADEAVTAHKNQVEETRVLTAEREELHVTMAELQNTMQSLETDQGYNVTKYQQEIRQLHARLEETMKDKRHLQQETDDARFKLETQSEKLRLMNLEREELNATLSSVKGTAKKALGDHDEYTRRFKNEIQQLHVKLDDAHSDKLKVEKAADEIRFAKDDLERRVQSLEEELASSRANTLRLEGIRREEQDTIRKMNTQLRRKESEKIDMEHFRNELERLKRHKDDLEGLVAHRKLESSASLKELEKELADSKRKNLNLEDGFHSIRMELSSSQKEKGELAEKLRSAYEATSQLSHKLGERGESIERLQSSYDHLESLRSTDQDVIAKLKEKLRNTESAALDVEQLNHKLSRLRQDRDYLYQQMESRKDEYERSMEEKSNEVSAYANQVESLKQDLKKVSSMDSTYRTDAEAQLRSLQASEDNLVRNLRQRDAEIAKLRDELAIRTDEINSLHRKEASTSNAEREVTRLQERLAKLEVTLDITTKEREDAVQKARSESSSQRSMLEELERARGEVHHLRNSLRDLNKELDERQEESLKAKERIFHMESTLREFKKEAKDRVNSLADREIDSHNILERTRHANRDLTNNLQSLNSIVERLRRERDMCFESLQDGQKKLSELSSRKDYVMPLDDLLTTPSYQRRLRSPRRREPRTAPRNSHPPVESVTARVSNRLVPEIYVSSYNLASPSTLAEERAEEIAACVAQNAKESLEENFEEVSQLRSQIYRLEDERSEQVTHLKAKVRSLENDLSYERVGCRNMKDEKSEQISSLRAKVRNLEKELSYDRLGNRTPVMGSTSQRSRKQNYFVDWDEKQSY